MPEPNNPSNNAVSDGQASAGTDPQPQEGNSTPQAGSGTQNTPSVDDLLRQIKDLRTENAAHRKKAQEQAQAAQAAEEARLVEQGEFKKLAEKYEARVKELEPVAQSYQRLAEQIHAQIESEIKDWPREVKDLVPGSDSPAESRLEQIARLRPLLEKLQQQARSQSPGNGPTPRPQNPTPADAVQAQLQRLRASGRY